MAELMRMQRCMRRYLVVVCSVLALGLLFYQLGTSDDKPAQVLYPLHIQADHQPEKNVSSKATPKTPKSPIPVFPGVFKEETLYSMSGEDVSGIYHKYVNTPQVKCGNVVRAGRPGDGGWDVCMDPPYKPSTLCNVYSFGIQNDFSFDDHMATKYGCTVHSYDPSMNRSDHLRGERVHFHNTGLAASDDDSNHGWRLRTLSSLFKENQHSHAVVDLLKFDIENYELLVIPNMLIMESLKNVKQLCFEMHIKRGYQPEPDKEKYIKGLLLFLDLYKEGFRIFRSHRNMYPKYKSRYGEVRTGCHEIYMIRTNTSSLDPSDVHNPFTLKDI